MHFEPVTQTKLFAVASAGGLAQLWQMLHDGAPAWSLVPPLLIAAATLVGAVRGLLNDTAARRATAARQRAEIDRLRRGGPFTPIVESLP